MEILDKVIFSSSIPKIIELGEEFIINGHIYTKNPITPKPLNFVAVNGTNEIYMNRTLFINNSSIGENLSNKMYFVDSENFNIYYSVLKDKLVRYIKTDDKTFVDKQITLTTGVYEFVFQDKQTIWLKGSYNKTAILIGYRKEDLTNIYSKTFINSRIFIICNDYRNIYFLISSTTTYIYKLSVITLSLETLLTEVLSGYNVWSSPTELKNNKIFIFQNKGNNSLVLKKYSFDFDNNSVLSEIVNIDIEISVTENNYGNYDTFLISTRDSEYVSLAIYSMGTSNLLNNKHCIYTFEKLENDNFKFIDNINFSPINYKGFMTSRNNKLLIFVNDYNIDFYEWNEWYKKYKSSGSVNGNFNILAIDSNNNTWCQNTSSEVAIISPFTGINIVSDFTEELYTFNGIDIESEVIVACQNYSGENLAVNLNLQLIGNVIFKENNKKTIKKTSNTDDFLRIPVVIIGAGSIEVFAGLE